MGITLQTNQREQAGSDVYNRYEYQVHWIVCQIISKLNSNPDCIVFCEYHDDMAELSDPTKDVFEYYQVKTKDDSSEWTVVDLSQKIKRKNGSYKHSFLGFIFYNFMQFGLECARCSFVSNAPMDIEIRTWQACIEDDLILKLEQPELYQKIKTRISEEYGDTKPDNFDDPWCHYRLCHWIHSQGQKAGTKVYRLSPWRKLRRSKRPFLQLWLQR